MMSSRFKLGFFVWLFALAVGSTAPVLAQNNNTEPNEPLDISSNPLFVSVSIGPNLMFTLDDSGSMQWEAMPTSLIYSYFLYPPVDDVYGEGNYDKWVPSFEEGFAYSAALRSPGVNAVYYDPSKTYKPWRKPDGTAYPAADPDAAYHNPFDTTVGSRDLTAVNEEWAGWDDCPTGPGADCDYVEETRTFWPALYYRYNGNGRWDYGNYERVEIRPGQALYSGDGRENRSDCSTSGVAATCTYDEEIQNFANWYTYYRSRILTSRAGIGSAFVELPSAVRVGFAAINKDSTDVDGVSTSTVASGVRDFNATSKIDFYDRLYGWTIGTSGTPLRNAAVNVGEYFEREDNQGPWSTSPGATDGKNLACRQSYHILMSDGYWNEGGPGVANSDGQAGPNITGPNSAEYQYSPSDPFQDDYSNTLADVAMDYWKRDLVSMDNRVPTTIEDPAFWQHVTSFGIGLGVRGSINPDDAFSAITTGDPVAWPDPTDNEDNDRIDDLLHFGVNGRGGFFSAADPEVFAQELSDILLEIVARSDATTSVAVSATRLSTSALVYAASFDSEDWAGEIAALNAETGAVEYLASTALETLGAAGRSIFTFDPSAESGLAFNASAEDEIGDRVMANAPQTAGWTFANVVSYLRGDDSLEQVNGGPFRNRDSMLGDIVNAQPKYSGAGNEGWGRLESTGSSYLEYIDEEKNDPRDCEEVEGTCNYSRKDTLFIGANDGMLHAFDARSLEEFFAYVPSTVHRKVHDLAEPDYTHQFYVDGQVAVADAYNSGWGTFLAGTLGAGGRGVYALDVTDPETFTANDVLWEFNSEDDADLGFTYGEPLITRLENGDWVAIFGNGYNSQDGQAYLYIVDLFGDPTNPSNVQKIALGEPGSNGLSGVVGWRDPTSRTFVSRIYAGDLKGNIWRVDFNNGQPEVVYEDALFTDPDGRAITATPNVAAHPAGGVMVYFGTGKLIEGDDRISTNMDRFYGIRDLDAQVGTNFNNNGVAEVQINTVTQQGDLPPLRTLESVEVGENGWFMDLAVGETSLGERTLAKPRVVFGTVIVSTYQPVEDPCTPGGIQRTYVMDALSGDGALPYCANCGAVEVGTGAPFSPPVAIKQRPPGSVGEVTFPGNPDPSDPTEPGDFPDAPPADGGERQGWCSEFGIPPLFEGSSFLPLGTICEGRQVWREVQ